MGSIQEGNFSAGHWIEQGRQKCGLGMRHRKGKMLDMVSNATQCLNSGWSCQGAWCESQTGSGEKQRSCKPTTLRGCETEGT
jgi:hypothetical protein